jgi:hypothetical protein
MTAMLVAATTIRIATARLIEPPSRQQSCVDTPSLRGPGDLVALISLPASRLIASDQERGYGKP